MSEHRFEYEADRLSQQKRDIQREIDLLDSKYSKYSAQHLPRIPMLSAFNAMEKGKAKERNSYHSTFPAVPEFPMYPRNVLLKTLMLGSKAEAENFENAKVERASAQKMPPPNIGTKVLEEIAGIRFNYLQGGGSNSSILQTINSLEAEAIAYVKSHDPIHQANIQDSKLEPRPQPATFAEIDAMSTPPYDYNRGFSIFIDQASGIPYYGGGSQVKLEVIHALFDGSYPVWPAESISTTCKRQAVSYVGQSTIEENLRYYDMRPSNRIRLLLQLTLDNAQSTGKCKGDIRPIAWTSLDIFNRADLNRGRWRLAMFYPPINFKQTTFHLYTSGQVVPNMFFYVRIENPVLHSHNLRVCLPDVDFHADYRQFKPSFIEFEEYPDLDRSRRFMPFDGDDLSPSQFGSLGSRMNLRGSKGDLGDDNLIGDLVYADVGIRVEQVLGFTVAADKKYKIKARIRIENETTIWTTQEAEIGFQHGSYGWNGDAANFMCKEIAVSLSSQGSLELLQIPQENPEEELLVAMGSFDIFKEGDSISIKEQSVTIDVFGINDSENAVALVTLTVYSDKNTPTPYDFDSQILEKPIPTGAWIEFSGRLASTKEITAGSVFKLAVDELRFLPENCTLTRVQCQIMTADFALADGFDTYDFQANLDSSAYFPQFPTASNIKVPSSRKGVVANLQAVFKIYTIDKYLRQLVTVGAAHINIFTNDQGDPLVTSDAPKIYLNEGYHQIAVYSIGKQSKKGQPLILTSRLPCCSLLLRIGANELPPACNYSQIKFNSVLSKPTEIDRGLFYYLVKERPIDFSIRNALTLLKQEIKAASDEALVSWMGKRITKEKGFIQQMEPTCIAKYHDGWGFRISIDCADNLRYRAFSLAIVSLSPPSTLYSSASAALKRKSYTSVVLDDVKYNRLLDFKSKLRSPIWKDGFLWYRNFKVSEAAIAVVDIRCLGYSGKDRQYRLQSQGWTILKLCHKGGFVNFGLYQLPLFEGQPTTEFLDAVYTNIKDFDDIIAEHLRSRKIKYVKRRGTVFLRICDSRRFRELPFRKADAVPSDAVLQKSLFDFDDSPPYDSLLPENISEDEYQRQCLQTLIDLSNLPDPMIERK